MRMRLLLLSAAVSAGPLGCWSAATRTFDTGTERELGTADSGGDAGDAGTGDAGTGGGTGGTGGTGGDTGPVDDLDGDGYSAEEGDCDDGDARVHPGALDDCDGWDEDCDEAVDEDAAADDAYEPNDDYGEATDLGSLEDEPQLSLAAYLHNAEDVDRFLVGIDDSWLDFFTLSVSLAEIPGDTTYQLTLTFRGPDGDRELASDYGSDRLELVVEDDFGSDETGDYEIRVEPLSEPDCGRAYQLDITLEQWI